MLYNNFLVGGNMSKFNIISQIYGYIICLVSILVFLFNLPGLINSIIDISNIGYARNSPSIITKSYEEWKIDFVRNLYYENPHTKETNQIIDIPNESELHNIYEL